MQETQETQIQSRGQEDSPGEGNGSPLQYSCLENPMDRGGWAGHSPWCHKELGMIEHTHTSKPIKVTSFPFATHIHFYSFPGR